MELRHCVLVVNRLHRWLAPSRITSFSVPMYRAFCTVTTQDTREGGNGRNETKDEIREKNEPYGLSGFQMGNESRFLHSTYLLFEKLHRFDLAVGQLARQGQRIDDLDQTGFLGPGQDGILANETVSRRHVEDVDE